jgi:transmembrane sensor
MKGRTNAGSLVYTIVTVRNPKIEAADWLAALRDDTFGEEEARALESWLAESEANRAAFDSLAAHSSKLMSLGDTPEMIALRAEALAGLRARRRRPMGRISALATVLMIGAGILLWTRSAQLIQIQTPLGQRSVTTLVDGSIVEVNSATRVEIRFDLFRRRVRLVQGEANFRVHPQWWRPFTVTTNDLAVRAVGTVFDVAQLSREARVVISEGTVRVDTPTGHFDAVTAGHRLVYDRELHDTTLGPARIDQDLAWREGRLKVDGVVLRELIEEFARYSPVRIELADPELGKLSISGDFDPNDPLTFARAVGKLRGLPVTVEAPDRVRLGSR